jgi:hypothetical protein
MTNSSTQSNLRRLLEEHVKSMHWCLAHLEDREVPFRLRKAGMSLAALAIALDYEMDGQQAEATHAMQQADWTFTRPRPFDPRTLGHG